MLPPLAGGKGFSRLTGAGATAAFIVEVEGVVAHSGPSTQERTPGILPQNFLNRKYFASSKLR